MTRVIVATLATTSAVTLASYWAPDDYKSTAVAFAFFAATYWLVLRGDDTATIRRYGLSLGGLTELEPLDYRRLMRDMTQALSWGFGTALVVFPAFWLGYLWWWKPPSAFAAMPLGTLGPEGAGQLLAIALPEEAFYRGYLQSELDQVCRPRWRLLGATVGYGWLAASAVFAIGHVLTQPDPSRLAVFFPALVFGWLRSRTGGIGAPIVFHAACNLFSLFLDKSYGLGS
jgi:membrane protease YdiL (CAAX protease family)